MIRNWLSKFFYRVLPTFSARLPSRTIESEVEGPYLTRFYLWPLRPRTSEEHDGFAVFLHFFWRGDQDQDLHNHPWRTSFSIILAGGYREERFDKTGSIVSTVKRPGDFNLIRDNDFHRVDLIHPSWGSWSLFVAGARTQEWGFKNRLSQAYVPWQVYLDGSN